MRRLKAQKGPHYTQPPRQDPTMAQDNPSATQLAHKAITHNPHNPHTSKTGPKQTATHLSLTVPNTAQPNPNTHALQTSPILPPSQAINHINPPPPSLSPPPLVLSGGTIVMETPPENMDIAMNAEPPDPGEDLFTGSEMDDIIAQGTEALIAYGNQVPTDRGDVEMAQ
ncbi:hypothetical protein PIB30_014327 [Stylosanthes scabra]|uniref:Uncharacterized protein n=1 Tax=Stylosanthes scabra TaxID=79078 RepID=A0ABU6R6F9_9FABA|nr:hypothetical protein [Stylosanthes scabra]